MNNKYFNLGIRRHPLTATTTIEYYYEHEHDCWEFLYVLKGECSSIVNGKLYNMKRGDIMFLGPHHKHRFEVLTKDEYEHRDIYVENEAMNNICQMLLPGLYKKLCQNDYTTVFKLNEDVLMNIDQSMRILEISDSKNISAEEYGMHYSLVAYLIGIFIGQKILDRSAYPNWLQYLLTEMNKPEIICGDLKHVISISNYSHEHLSRMFKKYMGETLVQYFTKQKMKYAMTLLVNTNKTILEISEAVGYSSISHFINNFKKYFGVVPSDYRKAFFQNRKIKISKKRNS